MMLNVKSKSHNMSLPGGGGIYVWLRKCQLNRIAKEIVYASLFTI